MIHNYRRKLGQKGEEVAAEYLQQKGYKIAALNFTTRVGEIDIIARSQEEIIFVEVKTAVSNKFGPPQYAVDKEKQQKIRKVAAQYLSLQRDYECCRFDVITLTGDEDDLAVEHIPAAF